MEKVDFVCILKVTEDPDPLVSRGMDPDPFITKQK
jgi:hypothetical protein